MAAPHGINARLHPPHPHVHAGDSGGSNAVLLSMFLIAGAQAGIFTWQQYSPGTYRVAVTLGLWILPLFVAVHSFATHNGGGDLTSSLPFLTVWLSFTGVTAYFLRLVMVHPGKLARDTPAKVYRYFNTVYSVSTAVSTGAWAGFGGLLLLSDMLRLSKPPFVVLDALLRAGMYSVYITVLVRDIAAIATEKLAATIASKKRDEEAEAAARVVLPRHSCALCDGHLPYVRGEGIAVEEGAARKPGSGEEEEEDASWLYQAQLPASPAAAVKAADSSSSSSSNAQIRLFTPTSGEPFFRLQSCGHMFHKECLMGWSIIGKKQTCPSCAERVDLSALLASGYSSGAAAFLAKPSMLWVKILDLVHWFVVWLPLLLPVLRFVFMEFGPTIYNDGVQPSAEGAGAGAGAGGDAAATTAPPAVPAPPSR